MELRRRFVFRGNAVAFGGRIVRPKDVTFTMPGASSLPVTGGRSTAEIAGRDFDGFLSFKSARTLADAAFSDDLDRLKEWTHRRVDEDKLTARTRVRAELSGLTVGTEKRVTVDRLAVELQSVSPRDRGEPPIKIVEVTIQNLLIDGVPLLIEFDATVFNEYDTHAKLVRAGSGDDVAEKHCDHFFIDRHGSGPKKFVPHDKQIYATVVKKIGQHPTAIVKDHNSVVVDGVGRIFFGELLISESTRRLTLMRLELGSGEGGSLGGPEVDVNGGWS
jgi:hypothetical protein